MIGSKPADADTPLRILLNRRQRDLLLQEIVAPARLMRPIRVAQVEGGFFHIRLTMDQLDELLDFIEDKESETKNKKLQEDMYDLCEHLEQFGLGKIVDMEKFRHRSNAFKNAKGYSAEGIVGLRQEGKSSLNEHAFVSDSNGHPRAPQEFNQMFLKLLEHQGRIPRSEIGGLSWEQFTKLLKSDWDDDHGLLRFDKTLKLKDVQKAPIFGRARTLLGEVVDSGGVKATVAGNLNRNFVALMLNRMTWPDGYIEHLNIMNKVINEQDVFPLHIIRIILDLSGLLVLKKGVFSASKKGKQLLNEDPAGALYHLLFKAQFQRMNLGYLDRMPSLPSFQETIAYSLFILSKTEMGWKRTSDLAEELVFPPVKEEMEKTGFEAHWFLYHRLFGTLQNFGLLERRDLPDQEKQHGVDLVRKTTLFDRFISFHPK
ncbi:MAG: hypothetical protein ACLP5H_03730 [Desulfomonilaceae bacterium]